MSDGYALALQKSLRTVLLADTDLAALISTRLYDEPPENVVFPYVRFGNITPDTSDTDGTENATVSFLIETYSRTTGRVEASQIAEAVRAALHRNEAPVTAALANSFTVTSYLTMENGDAVLLESGDKIINTDTGFRIVLMVCDNYFIDRDDSVGRGYTGRVLFSTMMETA
tara:strand:+ start:8282 stop:8794 length:513 start_codon:yes stop_codon:yes gene_type:complete